MEMLLWLTNVLQNEGAEKRLGAALKVDCFLLCRASECVKSGAPDFKKIMRGVDVKMWLEPSGRYRLDVQFRKTKTGQLAFGCTRSH